MRVTEDFLDEFVQENHDSIIQIMKNMADMMMILSKNVDQLSGELENVQKKRRKNRPCRIFPKQS